MIDNLAKICFQAYASAVAGQPIPEWEDLGDAVQGGWAAAADAVANFLMEPDAGDPVRPEDDF